MAVSAGSSLRFLRYSDIFIAVVVITILIMMLIPLPPLIVDVMLTFNITFALLVLLIAMNTLRPLDFSVFPSLLLVATLFRLALNVSTTRLILLEGYAGRVIFSFGQFVVGGNPVVGFIIFLILVIIQFVHIIAGNEMVALVSLEVAIKGVKGLLNLCFPYISLKPIAGKLSARYWFSKTEREGVHGTEQKNLLQRLGNAEVPILVEIGRSTITTGELLQLQVGDVISLDSKASGDIDVLIVDQPKYKARPGMVGEKLAVEITAIGKEGDDNG
jgi:hypothetical protein